ADPDGLANWVNQLTSGSMRRAQVVQQFWKSTENCQREVDGYYQNFLGRPADPSGEAYWIHALQTGVDETVIVHTFLLSPEEASASNSVFVQRLYKGTLGRDPTPSDLATWTNWLNTGALTRDQAAQDFIFSQEAA